MRALKEFHGGSLSDISAHTLSKAYDCFLNIRRCVDRKIGEVLGRAGEDDRLKRACPACFYRIESEGPLDFDLLCAADGNMSLKRFKKAGSVDTARFQSSYILERDSVDKYIHTAQARKNPAKRTAKKKKKGRKDGDTTMEVDGVDEDEQDAQIESETREGRDKDPTAQAQKESGLFPMQEDPLSETFKGVVSNCVENWKANADDAKKTMWECFEESGMFVVLCRHGHILLTCDIVRSGEQ